MYRGRSVAVVMPAYNEARLIDDAVASVPSFVDQVYVVDDCSSDRTAQVLSARTQPNLTVLTHTENRGVGAAIASGYRAAYAAGHEIVAVMAGDGQMDPADLPRLLDPLVERRADYVKGNRFRHREVWRSMPPARIVGNILLSVLTRFASGYRLFDSQCGYTAISRAAIAALDGRLFPRYGYLNDTLVRLKLAGARVAEVCVRPIYGSETSGITLKTVIHPILSTVFRSIFLRVFRRAQPRRAIERADADRHSEHLLPAPPH